MLWRWRNTIRRFMEGRYGTDELNRFLFFVYLAIWIGQLIFRKGVVALILSALMLILFVILIARTFSKTVSPVNGKIPDFYKSVGKHGRFSNDGLTASAMRSNGDTVNVRLVKPTFGFPSDGESAPSPVPDAGIGFLLSSYKIKTPYRRKVCAEFFASRRPCFL